MVHDPAPLHAGVDAEPAVAEGAPDGPAALLASAPGGAPVTRQKTTIALAVLIALVALPHLVPPSRSPAWLTRLRIGQLPWEAAAELDEQEARDDARPRAEAPAPSAGETALQAAGNQATEANALPSHANASAPLDPEVLAKTAGSLAIDDPTGHALDAFYTQLAATAAKQPGAVTRILHYGDSVITSDYISGTLRRRLQARYGDAGHGFILVANPWEWYFHNDVLHYAGEGWNANRITGPFTNDHQYGLGGVTFHGQGGAVATFGAADKGDYGRAVSRFDVYYLAQPGGGDFEVQSGDKTERVSTRAEAKASKVYSLKVEDGPRKMRLRAIGGGDVRLFGVVLERDVHDVPGAPPAPGAVGVVYDALGANGAQSLLWVPMDDGHWREQMNLRKPSLVVLQFGTNESEAPVFSETSYERTLTTVLLKVKAAAPGASVMLAAPLDRGERSGGVVKTKKIIPKIVASQKKVALANGCAFWNTYEAMGGEGTIGRWLKAKPALASSDLTHPTPAGAEAIGVLFEKAIVAGLEARRGRGDAGP
jgi:lysophospholipase L1-like esterase